MDYGPIGGLVLRRTALPPPKQNETTEYESKAGTKHLTFSTNNVTVTLR